MKKIAAILVLITLTLCSCKTKYIETIHYQPVEVHDTLYQATHVRDSVTLHDSIYIHQKNDTVLVEKWHTQFKWKTNSDTQYIIREIPHVFTDTICTIKEVPVEKVVYKQRWWQKALSWMGGLCYLGFVIMLLLKIKK